MGVSGLNTFIKKHGGLILRDYNLRSTRLIIDGQNVCHELFYTFQQKNSHFFGGDYDSFAKVCMDFFEALRHCDVTPYVIFDGAYDVLKLPTMLSKASDRIQTAKEVSQGNDGMVLPVMSYETFRDVVASMGIQHVTCNFDADHQAAALAILGKCPILSRDTDFLIYNVPAGVVLWDLMDVEKFVREANNGKNRNPTVKIYHVSAFLEQARVIDPSILPLWATLLSNDRVSWGLFKTFFDKFELPSTCGNIKVRDYKDKRMARVLEWLKSMPTVDDALKTLLNHCSADEGSAIRASIAAYTDLTCEVEGHFKVPIQLTGVGSLESFAKKKIPNRFMEGIRSGKIPVRALDALVLRRVTLKTQVSVTSQPSPHQCSFTLRRFLYSVLLRWDDDLGDDAPAAQLEGSFIEEYDRDQNLQLNIEQVHALTHLESGRRIPSLDEIPQMTEPERRSLLLDVLGVTSPQLDGLEPRTHILMASIVHWMRHSIPSVNQLHLESLLVCFHRAGILGDRIRGNDDSIKGLRKTPDEISPQTFDCAVVHSFAQFQCCLQMALYVNQILLLPAPNPLPVLAFNGTFLHNFYRKLMELRCQPHGQQEHQMQLDEEQEEEGWQQQKQRRPRRQMRQQRHEQPIQQQQTTPKQQHVQQIQQQQRQQQQRHVWDEQLQTQPLQHEQNRQQYHQQHQQQLQCTVQQESSCGQYLVCYSIDGVNSENLNPLETACADVSIYRDKLLSII